MFVKQTALGWKVAFDRAEQARWRKLITRVKPLAQSSRPLYLAVESALREVAKRNKIPLAHLDRMIFQASGKSLLDFYLGENSTL